MYTLFYSPGSAAMAPHAALEEIGATHTLVKVDLKGGEHRKPEYLKLNPKGRVPTLIVDDKVYTESAALLMFLSDRHPEAKLAPEPKTLARGHFYQWLLYLSNTVQAAMMEFFHPDWWFEDAAMQAALKASAQQRIDKMFAYIDEELGKGGPYLVGAQFSAADLFLHMTARWSRFFAKPAYEYRNIKRCVDLVKDRPAVQRMMTAQGITHVERA